MNIHQKMFLKIGSKAQYYKTFYFRNLFLFIISLFVPGKPSQSSVQLASKPTEARERGWGKNRTGFSGTFRTTEK